MGHMEKVGISNGNETETGNANWKWELELEIGTKNTPITGAMFSSYSVKSHYSCT